MIVVAINANYEALIFQKQLFIPFDHFVADVLKTFKHKNNWYFLLKVYLLQKI